MNDKKLKTVTIRIDDATHKALKLMTVNEEISIRDYITGLVLEDMKKKGMIIDGQS